MKMKLTKDEYLAIRKAQAQGARTIEYLQKMTDIVMEDDEKLRLINDVLANACRCKDVLLEEIIVAVKNGADTVEKIGELTGAGTVCGRCHGILESVIKEEKPTA